MKKLIFVFLVLTAFISLACNLSGLLPKSSPTPTSPMPTATQIASPTPVKPLATSTPTAKPSAPIQYYYFLPEDEKSPPKGSVVVLKDILVLAPTSIDQPRSPDPATNLRAALQAMIGDPRNAWQGTSLTIASLTFKNGAAAVELKGEMFGAGDIVLIAARLQFLLTIFSEDAMQTAIVKINGKNIANLGISHESQAKPPDFAYTRADIEKYIAENAYKNP